MFTGIVEELGRVVAIEHGLESAVLRIGGDLVRERRPCATDRMAPA